MPPFMGLSSWAAFTPVHIDEQTAMMGDTVVFEHEVNPVMSAAFDAGLEVTALHNHFFFNEPKDFMHISGDGETKALAAGVVYDKIDEIHATNPTPVKSFTGNIATSNSITAAPLEATLSQPGMFKLVIDGFLNGKHYSTNQLLASGQRQTATSTSTTTGSSATRSLHERGQPCNR